MPLDNKNEPIKITLDDLASVDLDSVSTTPGSSSALEGGAKVYGSVSAAAEQTAPPIAEEKGTILLQAWFYLGLAGLVGALAGWGLCEHWIHDGAPGEAWHGLLLIAAVVTLQCVGYGVAESIVERSAKKGLLRGGLAIPLGLVFGFVISFIANIVFFITTGIVASLGVQTWKNPAFWIARGVAWMVLGVAAGGVYGIVGMSSKKAMYGILGGVIGAGVGGMLFDPIVMMTKGGAPSRAVGFGLLGMATGIAMGLVESALKDRWFYVTAGPLAGKQFILYKPRTVIGSDQKSDIYLFKDANIQPQHAFVEIAGARVQLRAVGPLFVSGSPARLHVLQSGNIVQIGRYTFRYQEKQRR